MKKIELYIDGASKGNPGPSAIGVVICQNGQTIKNISDFIGNATNNIAEYTALIYALQEAVMLRADVVEIRTDSQLLDRQLNGLYKIKNDQILRLYNQALHLIRGFESVLVSYIPRENNKGADRLANQAIKKHACR